MYPVNLAPQAIGPRRLLAVVFASMAVFAATLIATPVLRATQAPSGPLTSVIVREAPGAGDQPERLVDEYGGSVTNQLPLIDGFSAEVPSDSFGLLESSPFIDAVTPNAALQLSSAGWEDASSLDDAHLEDYPGALPAVNRWVRARDMWSNGYTGAGVDVALIDSGVVPVNGLTAPGKVVNGPDLSFESQHESLRHLDTFGHGTHMAGIIAGRDNGVTGNYAWADPEDFFIGVAPDARVVSVKVADAHGVTDVSQVIAAIDWVVQHRNDNGMNIRVLNLSFGTNSTQSYVLDPLAFAVEQAWNNGIVVVVAAGNDGNGHPLRNPATDPFVIAVGALDQRGSRGSYDDVVASFSNCGTAARHVDVIAPGRSILSLRAPGSHADVENPDAVVAQRLFLGSGTSQSAAVVSGVVALLLDENPSLTPDGVKTALMEGAKPMSGASAACQGSGLVDAQTAADVDVPRGVSQGYKAGTGLGSLEAARGTDHLSADGVVLKGEIDIHGNAWNPVEWSYDASKLQSWTGGDWNGATWSGATWSGKSWSSATWSSATWSGATWSGATWSSATWSGATWSSATWSGATWSGATWSGATWSGLSWLGFTWGSSRSML